MDQKDGTVLLSFILNRKRFARPPPEILAQFRVMMVSKWHTNISLQSR